MILEASAIFERFSVCFEATGAFKMILQVSANFQNLLEGSEHF